jgi:hypothetical protein
MEARDVNIMGQVLLSFSFIPCSNQQDTSWSDSMTRNIDPRGRYRLQYVQVSEEKPPRYKPCDIVICLFFTMVFVVCATYGTSFTLRNVKPKTSPSTAIAVMTPQQLITRNIDPSRIVRLELTASSGAVFVLRYGGHERLTDQTLLITGQDGKILTIFPDLQPWRIVDHIGGKLIAVQWTDQPNNLKPYITVVYYR